MRNLHQNSPLSRQNQAMCTRTSLLERPTHLLQRARLLTASSTVNVLTASVQTVSPHCLFTSWTITGIAGSVDSPLRPCPRRYTRISGRSLHF